MPRDPDAIHALQRRLTVYRHTLAFLQRQRDEARGAVLAEIADQIRQTRDEIRRLTQQLRSLGHALDDDDDAADDEPASAPDAELPGGSPLVEYARALVERLRPLPDLNLELPRRAGLWLTDVYVARGVVPLAPDGERSGSAASAAQPASLLDLVGVPGARVALEDDAGSGKSTCLRVLALAAAAAVSGVQLPPTDTLAGYRELAFLPLLLNAADLVESAEREAQTLAALPAPADYEPMLRRSLKRWGISADAQALLQALGSGECIVLLDGADELPAAEAAAALDAAEQLIARFPANRYVVAHASLGERGGQALAGFTRCAFAPLDPAQQTAMIERYYRAFAGSADEAKLRGAELHSLILSDEWLRDIGGRPLGLALLVGMRAEGRQLHGEELAIARRLCDLLAGGWNARVEPRTAAASEPYLAALEPLAVALMSGAEPAVGAERAAALLRHDRLPGGFAEAHDLLDWYRRRGFLTRAGAGGHAISWRWLRAYLAGRDLAARPDFAEAAFERRDDANWHKALLVAYESIARGDRPQRAYDFVNLLLRSSRAQSATARGDLLLAGEGLAALGDHAWPGPETRAEVAERLLLLSEERAASVAERIKAGTLLGKLGDPRFAGAQPPLAHIPGGAFVAGDSTGYEDEGPAHRMAVPSFQIGIYPVTNREYAVFLAETGHTPPHYWNDPRFNNPSYPVVGITWHDAQAYCRWLTARLAATGLLDPGTLVRLPTEFEWEKAASWDPRREVKLRYPWGYDWDSTRANTADRRGTWVTAPVGCYPSGVSPYGLHDCLGNVWEWTASTYASYPGAPRSYHEPGSYVLRGSSCVLAPTNVRCTYRSRLPASYWRYHLGFRVVVARPLPEETF